MIAKSELAIDVCGQIDLPNIRWMIWSLHIQHQRLLIPLPLHPTQSPSGAMTGLVALRMFKYRAKS